MSEPLPIPYETNEFTMKRGLFVDALKATESKGLRVARFVVAGVSWLITAFMAYQLLFQFDAWFAILASFALLGAMTISFWPQIQGLVSYTIWVSRVGGAEVRSVVIDAEGLTVRMRLVESGFRWDWIQDVIPMRSGVMIKRGNSGMPFPSSAIEADALIATWELYRTRPIE